jgi:hypothetical protein
MDGWMDDAGFWFGCCDRGRNDSCLSLLYIVCEKVLVLV